MLSSAEPLQHLSCSSRGSQMDGTQRHGDVFAVLDSFEGRVLKGMC